MDVKSVEHIYQQISNASSNEHWTVIGCRSEMQALYPNKFIQYDESRIYILNTLFNLPGM